MGCFSATNLLQICEFPLFFEVSKTGKVKIMAKLNLKTGFKIEKLEVSDRPNVAHEY